MADPSFRGRFVWHELMTSDTKSAAAFYTKAIGWKTQAWDQNPSYTMFTAKGRPPMAGLMALPEAGAPSIWLPYIATPNVDETAKQAEGLGGRVLKKPTDIPTIGRFAVVQDPQGAMFAAFTPLQGSAAPGALPTVGDFSWHELATTDWRGALAFYKSLFGWEETQSMDMGPEGTYQMYGWKGRTLGGMMNRPKQSPGQPTWLSYIEVPDAKKAAATVKKLGGRIVSGPHQVPGGGWIAVGLDLQGVAFAVHTAAKTVRKKSKPRKAKAAKRAAARKPAVKKQKMQSRKRASSRKKVASRKRR